MNSKEQDFTKVDIKNYPNLVNYKIGLVVSEWNIDITTKLLKGAEDKLIELGVNRKNIIISWVPGSFELVFGSKELSKKNLDAVIAIGCVIKGETDHYDYICSSVSNGLMQLNISGSTPIIFVFGLKTLNTLHNPAARPPPPMGTIKTSITLFICSFISKPTLP